MIIILCVVLCSIFSKSVDLPVTIFTDVLYSPESVSQEVIEDNQITQIIVLAKPTEEDILEKENVSVHLFNRDRDNILMEATQAADLINNIEEDLGEGEKLLIQCHFYDVEFCSSLIVGYVMRRKFFNVEVALHYLKKTVGIDIEDEAREFVDLIRYVNAPGEEEPPKPKNEKKGKQRIDLNVVNEGKDQGRMEHKDLNKYLYKKKQDENNKRQEMYKKTQKVLEDETFSEHNTTLVRWVVIVILVMALGCCCVGILVLIGVCLFQGRKKQKKSV